MKARWQHGNRVQLLENGEEFFPRVFEAIRNARHDVMIETFILFEDEVGEALRDALLVAARRGVSVGITVDGYGSPEFSLAYLESLREAGVRMRVFDPRPRLFGLRTNMFRRLHRKIVVVDRRIAFVGGINFSKDQLAHSDGEAKQDYAIEIEGPIVDDIDRAARKLIDPKSGKAWTGPVARWRARRSGLATATPAGARAALVIRDNNGHADDIEWHYRAAIRSARKRIVIANAYFLPGYRLLKSLRDAARRGVDVRLILQGQPDLPLVTAATRSLYRYLLPAGVTIFEYCQRQLHGKVALVDDSWATVGSSNLDPLSLSMNLEANVLVQDGAFNACLHERLQQLADDHCTRIESDHPNARGAFRPLLGVMLFHVLRYFPRFATWLPTHSPKIAEVRAQVAEAGAASTLEPAEPDADDNAAMTGSSTLISSFGATCDPADHRQNA